MRLPDLDLSHAPGPKAVIAFVAFPLFTHVLFLLGRWLVRVAMPEVTELAGEWANTLETAGLIGAFLVAVRISFRICRHLWPTPRVKAS